MLKALFRGVVTGTKLAAVTATVMAAASTARAGTPWGGYNAMATAVMRDGDVPLVAFQAPLTLGGLALLTSGLVGFGVAYEVVLSRLGKRRSLLTGALCAGAGFALDKSLLPSHLLRNFQRSMGMSGTVAKYAAMALAAR